MVVQGSGVVVSDEMKDLINSQQALAVDFQKSDINRSQSLQGKTLLVTGGASGFGETFITTFVKNTDCAAIIADLDRTKGEQLEENLCQAGCNVKFIHVDVTNWQSVTNLFRQALTWLKTLDQSRTIDHVICSAGVDSEVLDLDPVNPDIFLQDGGTTTKAPASLSIQISIIGSLYTVAAAMKFGMGLHRHDSGVSDKSITLLASLAGYTGMALRSDYTASKWGVRGLFRSLLDDRNSASCPVRINLLAPYFVATPLTAHLLPGLQKMGVKLAEIGDVRDAALRLVGDRSIHGRAIGVWQGGPVDLGDDFGGAFGSQALRNGTESGALVQILTQVSRPRETHQGPQYGHVC
jgi:5'-hydroxyaverantin dehydrogenase